MKSYLEVAALILAMVNGLTLLYQFLTNRPKIRVSTVHPEVYNWFIKLPSKEFEGKKTNRLGFLLYISLANSGQKAVSVISWRLVVSLRNRQKAELKPISIPAPQIEMGDGSLKVFPVLGQISPSFNDRLYIQSGDSTAGFAYYELQTWGEGFLPVTNRRGEIEACLVCEDVFGHKANTMVSLKEENLDKVNKLVPNFDKISETSL